jgi:hypothetical protein
VQGQLNFSRDVEREADRVGFQVMTAAGYAPDGMAAMFQRMDRASHLNDYGGYPYLRSHPLTVERIGEARARATALEGRGSATPASTPLPGVLEHTVAQARASVLMDSRTDALRRWQARDADRDGSAADRMRAASESAIASSMLRDWARADAAFATARAVAHATPGSARAERAVALMQAQSLVDRGAATQAADAMKAYANDGSRPTLLLESEIALRTTPATAPDNAALKTNASTLQTWVAVHPLDSLAWDRARADVVEARPAAALDPRRGRSALRARRPAGRGRTAARRPASRARRRPGRLHRRFGARLAAACDRGRSAGRSPPTSAPAASRQPRLRGAFARA